MTESTKEKPEPISDNPWWISEYGPQLARKTHGRIWVRTEEDRLRVLEIIEQIDHAEFECYMPEDFVAVMPDHPSKAKLVYGHKFELREDLLSLACWKAGIEIWIVTGIRQP